MSVAWAEGGADDVLAQSGHHGADLIAAKHPGSGIAAFVVHPGDQRGPFGEFRFAEAKSQAARLVQANIRSGGLTECVGEGWPEIGRVARPMRIRWHAGAF